MLIAPAKQISARKREENTCNLQQNMKMENDNGADRSKHEQQSHIKQLNQTYPHEDLIKQVLIAFSCI